jgi:hypothetical protein
MMLGVVDRLRDEIARIDAEARRARDDPPRLEVHAREVTMASFIADMSDAEQGEIYRLGAEVHWGALRLRTVETQPAGWLFLLTEEGLLLGEVEV